MVILGIDPGLAIVGWGVVDYAGARFRTLGYGSIETPAGMDTPQRLLTIRRGMNALLKKYRPEQMAIEELFFTKNITTGIRVAEARGNHSACRRRSRSAHGGVYADAGQAGSGRLRFGGKASGYCYGDKAAGAAGTARPDDTADALAIAVCHAHTGCSRLAEYFNRK